MMYNPSSTLVCESTILVTSTGGRANLKGVSSNQTSQHQRWCSHRAVDFKDAPEPRTSIDLWRLLTLRLTRNRWIRANSTNRATAPPTAPKTMVTTGTVGWRVASPLGCMRMEAVTKDARLLVVKLTAENGRWEAREAVKSTHTYTPQNILTIWGVSYRETGSMEEFLPPGAINEPEWREVVLTIACNGPKVKYRGDGGWAPRGF
jgi:hypothetical protein